MSFQTLEGLTVRARVARVNLLPAGIDDARTARTTRFLLAAGLVVVAAACATAGVISGHHVDDAQTALSVEQSKTASLRAAQKPYAEVPAVQAELAAAQKVQSTVNAKDVAWYSYLEQIAEKSPQDLSLTSLALSTSTASAATTTSGSPTADPLQAAGVGTLTVTGQTKSQAQVASWMEGMATIPGFQAPELSNSAFANGVVTFTATSTLTDTVLQSKQ